MKYAYEKLLNLFRHQNWTREEQYWGKHFLSLSKLIKSIVGQILVVDAMIITGVFLKNF